LNSLGAIVATRAGIGITEAFIMTCCTTLLADYFVGNRRNKYLGLQALVTALAATVFFAVGGAAGAAGWRTPFWLYVVSAIVAVIMIGAIWPTNATSEGEEKRVGKLPPLPWARLALPTAVAVFGGLVFYTLIVELPYVLNGLGVTETAQIGIAAALASLATAIGAFTFRFIAHWGVKVLLPLAFALSGAGMLVVCFTAVAPAVVAGAVITGLGTGILLPTMITWSISRLAYEQRGRGTGLFTGAIFLGEFVTPLVVLALTAAMGTLALAIGVIGVASIVACIMLAFILRAVPQPDLVVMTA
jgi:MFS family permease